MTVQITILGLNQIGASIGLALANQKEKFKRLGNDRNVEIAKKAMKMGAVDDVVINLPSAIRKADVIILAIPVDDIYATLETIAPDLKEDVVVIDTSALKSTIADWVKTLLPVGRHFVSLTPALNPQYFFESSADLEGARADLFKNSLMAITCPPNTNREALKLATDLAKLLGAGVLFADQMEVDGLLAASQILPQLTAAALLQATTDQPGWREGRKLAGIDYAQATAPILHLDGEQSAGQIALSNKENTVRVIDNLIDALQTLRTQIASDDGKALHTYITKARQDRQTWWLQRQRGEWERDGTPHTTLPTSGENLSQLFLGGIGKRKN